MKKGGIFTFDVETKYSDKQVNGWGNAHLMEVSVAVGMWDPLSGPCPDECTDMYIYSDEPKELFLEMGYAPSQIRTVAQLVEDIDNADFVVSWNGIAFDYKVLKPYDASDIIYLTGEESSSVECQNKSLIDKSVDMRALTRKGAKGFGKLEGAGQATIGRGKTEGGFGGLQALIWWQEYSGYNASGDDFYSSIKDVVDDRITPGSTIRSPIDPLRDITVYCIGDTELTRDIFWHGVIHGKISIDTFKEGIGVKIVEASWQKTIQDARTMHSAMEYIDAHK